MRLADFILTNREPILIEWEAFASTCAPASGEMDMEALRDHANGMLTVIAKDLKTPQSDSQQSEKSKGNEATDGGDDTAAERHGSDRAESGFSVEQMVSEFRALRASVIRLWTREQGTLAEKDLEDLTRFNEAIDQSLAESVTQYTQELDYSKEAYLAILAHDLRTPLGAVSASAKFMLDTNELKEPHSTLTSRIASSTARMGHLVDDLLDFTRSRLGGGIPIERTALDMEKVVRSVIDDLKIIHPKRTLQVEGQGDLRGEWDNARICQALTNLVGNALEHGSDWTIVRVLLRSSADEVSVAIQNRGAAIPPEQLEGIFRLIQRKEVREITTITGASGNLGLGLFIADRIVNAHGGRIEVESSEKRGGTTFTVHLPRHE